MTPDVRSRLIGVVDLKGGRAVHAIAGKRERYSEVTAMWLPEETRDPVGGDPIAMIRGYRRWKLNAVYCADLDSISGAPWQQSSIQAIADECGPDQNLYLDLGVSSLDNHAEVVSWVAQRSLSGPSITLVIGSESAGSPDLLSDLRATASQLRLGVSLDYLNRRWSNALSDESDWIEACRGQTVSCVIALDLASVGVPGIERTTALCRRIRKQLPHKHLITGGGVRSASDIHRLVESGADELLSASLFIDDASPFGASD